MDLFFKRVSDVLLEFEDPTGKRHEVDSEIPADLPVWRNPRR